MANVIEILINARDDASNVVKNVSLSLDNIGNSLIGVGGALTAATAPIAAFFATSIKAASDQQTAMTQLEAVLKSTGMTAGVTAEQALDLSDSLAKVTRFGDDAILSAENLLLTFTNIGKDVFPEAIRTVLDMSQALGQDLSASAMQLGKALNDPIQGIGALRRVGVQLTDEQETLIKTMVEAGDVMGAQRMILAELTREFGGSAEAAGNTFAGKLDILNNKFGELQEKIGFILIPILEKAVDAFDDVVESVMAWTEANPELTRVITMVGAALVTLGPLLIGIGTAMKVLSFLKIGSIFMAILNPVKLLGIALAVLTSPIGLIVAGLTLLATVLGVDLLGGFQAVLQQVGFFVNAIGEQGLGGAIRQFFTTFEDGSSRLSTIFEGFGMAREQAQALGDTINNVVQGIAAALSGDIAGGFRNFIEAGLNPDIATRAVAVLDAIGDGVRNFVEGAQRALARLPDDLSLLAFYAEYHFGNIKLFFERNVIAPMRGLWEIIRPVWEEVAGWWESTLRPELEKVPGWIQDNIINPLESFWSAHVEPIVSQVAIFVTNVLQPVKDWIDGVLATLQATWSILQQLGGYTPPAIGVPAPVVGIPNTGSTETQQDRDRKAAEARAWEDYYRRLGGGVGGGSIGIMDSGGRGYPGVPVAIGVGAQPEIFIPDSAGSFYPRGEGLGGGGITVEPGGIVIYESNDPARTQQAVIDALVVIARSKGKG